MLQHYIKDADLLLRELISYSDAEVLNLINIKYNNIFIDNKKEIALFLEIESFLTNIPEKYQTTDKMRYILKKKNNLERKISNKYIEYIMFLNEEIKKAKEMNDSTMSSNRILDTKDHYELLHKHNQLFNLKSKEDYKV